jgi:opacity protein-like surface antigen
MPEMKKSLIALSVLLLSAGAAQADDMFGNDMFVSVLGGWSAHPGLSIGSGRNNTGDDYNLGARVGTSLPFFPGFTTDIDYFYNQADYTGASSRLNSQSVMGDLMYHLPLPLPVDLYGGAGVGMVNDNLAGALHGNSTVLGWQAIGGAELPIGPVTSLFAEYRYQNAHDADIGTLRNVGNTSNNVSVGVKFHL